MNRACILKIANLHENIDMRAPSDPLKSIDFRMKNSLSIFAILILAAILIAFTESRTITGNVTDDQGLPVSGVNIIVKGKSARFSTSSAINI